MKRSQRISLPSMRKSFVLRPLAAVVGATVLAGCSDDTEEVTLIRSIQECINLTGMDIQQCEAAYQTAERESEATAEKFESLNDCERSYGNGACGQGSGNWFVPMMTGYVLAEVVDEVGDSMKKRRYKTMGVYRNERENEYYTTTGAPLTSTTRYGSYKVNPKAVTPTTTMLQDARRVKSRGTSSSRMTFGRASSSSRGGFGSTSSSRSSWGG